MGSAWTSVVRSYARLWIVGPPGMGKSCAAFAFACSLKRVGADLYSGRREEKWDVLWIHCSKIEDSALLCILFSGEKEKRTCTISRAQVDAVLESLGDYTVVFLDGYVKERHQHAVLGTCGFWRSKSKKCRRIVVVCSMVSMGKDWRPDLYDDIPAIVASSLESMSISPAMKINATQGDIQEERLFKLFSWTLSDYQAALRTEAFFEHVKTKLTAESSVEMETLMELLEEKFFVVGGSARMMFDVSTQRAMDSLLFALDSTPDITQYLESVSVINRLFSWYPGVIATRPKPCIVSTFVAREIALRIGPAKLQALAKCLAKNPSKDGHLFEMWFFSSLDNGGAHCCTIQDGMLCGDEVWASAGVVRFDPFEDIPLELSQQWLAPIKWNQGGYDAIFLELEDVANTEVSAKQAGFTKKLLVRFVQVTRSKTHSFKVDYYKDLLSRLTLSSLIWLHKVEVCFVVPVDVIGVFTLPVHEVTFRKEAVQAAFYPGTRPRKGALKVAKVVTDICIRVVALEYDMYVKEMGPRVGEKRSKH
ncbi:hypothetical protein PHYPSEUDO_008430 [Phytophthora pseudosyringae]|uniref:Crinkler (CRN) family protein n=1 Tax=Phytophthora pseudosyringae TaxID=221518 RepID=A0A8T1W8J5_9STRA|nr:hypothetical protein PHYPSEUDO_008430 [Phytophthora pseudosyringae]